MEDKKEQSIFKKIYTVKIFWPLASLIVLLLFNFIMTPSFLSISIKDGHLFGNTIEIAKDLFDNKQRYKEAIEIFEKFKDDSESEYYIGKAYYYGIGAEKDEKKAFEYAKKSADKNNSSGLNLKHLNIINKLLI